MPIFGSSQEGGLFKSPQSNAHAVGQHNGIASLPGMEAVSFGGSQAAPPGSLTSSPVVADTGFYVEPSVNEGGYFNPVSESPSQSAQPGLDKTAWFQAFMPVLISQQTSVRQAEYEVQNGISMVLFNTPPMVHQLFQAGQVQQYIGAQQMGKLESLESDEGTSLEFLQATGQIALQHFQTALGLFHESFSALD